MGSWPLAIYLWEWLHVKNTSCLISVISVIDLLRYNVLSLTKMLADKNLLILLFWLATTAPSSAPVINKQETKAEDAHTIRVKWNEIKKEDQNGRILGYEVSYKENGTEKVLSFNVTNTNKMITDLKPFTSYCIQVRGFTSVGKSPPSPCTDVQTLDKGMPSLNLVWFIIILELREYDLRGFFVGETKEDDNNRKKNS